MKTVSSVVVQVKEASSHAKTGNQYFATWKFQVALIASGTLDAVLCWLDVVSDSIGVLALPRRVDRCLTFYTRRCSSDTLFRYCTRGLERQLLRYTPKEQRSWQL
jgi:hypothetical protein